MSSSYHFPKRNIKNVDIHSKRILLRADFNVPLNEKGEIDSDFRIQTAVPTIQYLLKRQCEVVILAHLGRPEGKVSKKESLEPIGKRLQELLGHPIEFIHNCVGDGVKQVLKKHQSSRVSLLENVRFHSGEEKNDPQFAKDLIEATNPDYIVQDGFGVVHRAHASTEGISHLKPALAGLLLEKEVTSLSRAIAHPNKPLVAVIGGAKIADKLPLIERFLNEADTILVGGALANTFLKFTGHDIGKSMYEADQEAEVKKILQRARLDQIVLPTDIAVAKEVSVTAQRREIAFEDIAGDDNILDVGPYTIRDFCKHLEKAGTVIWNGPIGYAENPQFAKSSEAIAECLSDQYPSLESIIGGGDTADFVLGWQAKHPKAHFSHISTGGGASLELLSGMKLPGVEALLDA